VVCIEEFPEQEEKRRKAIIGVITSIIKRCRMARRLWSRKYLSDTNEDIVEYKENEEEGAEQRKKEDIEWKRKRDQRAESEVPGSNAIHRIFNNFPSDEVIRNLWPEIIKSDWMQNGEKTMVKEILK